MSSKDRSIQTERRATLFVPVLLIGLGGLFITDNIGIINIDWYTFFQFGWPLLVVALGIILIFGRYRPVLGATLALLVLGGTFSATMMWGDVEGVRASHAFEHTIERTHDFRGADVAKAVLEINMNAGNLELQADDQHDLLSRAEYAHSQPLDFHVDDGVATFQLQSQSDRQPWHVDGANEKLSINSMVPFVFDIQLNASNAELDLSKVHVEKFELEANAGAITLTLPERAATLEIQLNAAELTLNVPDATAVRIKIHANLSHWELPEGFYEQDGYSYSANWNEAEHQVEVEIEAHLSSFEIE